MKALATNIVVLIALVLVNAGPSYGQTVSHLSIPGTERDITDITGFMTTGEAMGGMRVTAHFSAGLLGDETVNWNPGVAGSGAGSAVGTGWRLDQSGDTWNSQWRLFGDGANLTLFGLTLEGFMESDQPVSDRATVFDRTDPFFGTDGSYRGNDLEALASAGAWTHVRVVYTDEVDNLADGFLGAVGDVYRVMQIQFGNLVPTDPLPIFQPAPFLVNNELLFLQDTDTVGERIPGDPGEEGAPEPTGIVMLAIGLVLTSLSRDRARRRR
jgi:hypothetical protein